MDNLIYNKFRVASNKQLAELKTNDIVLFERDEIPENYTLIAPPTEEVLHAIHTVAQKCPNYMQGQYLYPVTELHLTMIGNVNVSTDPELIMATVRKATQDMIPGFHMVGVASNMHAVSISCYPQDFSIFEFRQQIRSAIKNKSDDYTVHLQEYEHMGWINFMRYHRRPTAAELEEFRSLIHEEFGVFRPTKLQLYKNRSKVLNSEKRELVGELLLH